MRLTERMEQYSRRIETLLAQLYENPGEPQRRLFEAMQYSLLAGGKRLRPCLVYAFCALCGGSPEQADPAAASVELIHTYSLIHDDLPCMDNDDLRRGKPTNHKVYGEATAVLAGDSLLTDAFRVLAESKLPPERTLACVRLLSECAGPWGMAGGQALDMLAEQRVCSDEEVLAIQSRKTGALIRAACMLGVHCAGGTKAQLVAAAEYADALGLAFQIRDDVLDATSDEKTMGKGVRSDENKNTFVRLYGIEVCEKKIAALTEQAVRALDAFDDPADLRALAEYLAGRDH